MLQCNRNSLICAGSRQTGALSTGSSWAVAACTSFDLMRRPRARDKQLVTTSGSCWSLNGSGSLMPRYFFNTRIGDELIADPEGEELRNADRAWEVARAMIRELLKTEDTRGGLLNAVLEVTDDEGEIVLEFPFTEAIFDLSGGRITRH